MDSVTLIRHLVQIPSVFPHEEKLGGFMSKYLVNLGFKIDKIPTEKGRNNIVATYGKAKKYLGFYGHLDTVPPDKNYKVDPFTIVRDRDRIYGLGTADMKGGITALLKLAEFAIARKLPVKLIFGVDEENISEGAHDLVDSRMLNNIDFLISAESGQIKNIKQKYSVCYGRRGRIAIRIEVYGKTVHAAESNKGISAIENAALLLLNLPKVKFPSHPKLGLTNFVVHSINASTNSFSIPDYCECIVSALTTPSTTSKDVLNKLNKLAKKLSIPVSVKPLERQTSYAESYEVDLNNAFLKKIEDLLFRPAGVMLIYTESVADENIFAKRLKIPVITIGPIGSGDHTADEWVSLSSINNAINCYQQILTLYFNQ